MEDNIPPKMLDELLHLRADNAQLLNQVSFLHDQCAFLREIINKFLDHA